MKKAGARLILALAVAGLPLIAQAQSTPAAQQLADGKALAQKVCMSCHVVSGSGSGSDAAPSFATIATTRDDAFLHTWLMKPHGNMPPVDLTNDQIDALAAYIESQRK